MRGATWCLQSFDGNHHDFNPRAPCGARPLRSSALPSAAQFQSTRPMRGATNLLKSGPRLGPYFNPRAPCGARPWHPLALPGICRFQSTRPMRGATSADGRMPGADQFQSTRPMRGATAIFGNVFGMIVFQSTRPMRGATRSPPSRRCTPRNFNPRAPCGARQQKYTKLLYTLLRQKAILR